MTYSDILTLIGDLTNDPNSDRYSTAQRTTELDNTMNDINIEIGVITDVYTTTTVAGTRQYALSGFTGTPIGIKRVTLKGLPLKKRSKAYFDLFSSGTDWTTLTGTPAEYCVESDNPSLQFITLKPTPTGSDVGSLVVEYIKAHTPMAASSDVPFMSGASSNTMLRPYDWYWCYATAARLLGRDPSDANVAKSTNYAAIGRTGKAELMQIYKALEKEIPITLRPARMGIRRRSIR